jgi:hypothetical protein
MFLEKQSAGPSHFLGKVFVPSPPPSLPFGLIWVKYQAPDWQQIGKLKFQFTAHDHYPESCHTRE